MDTILIHLPLSSEPEAAKTWNTLDLGALIDEGALNQIAYKAAWNTIPWTRKGIKSLNTLVKRDRWIKAYNAAVDKLQKGK